MKIMIIMVISVSKSMKIMMKKKRMMIIIIACARLCM